jgi:hypothetical protein
MPDYQDPRDHQSQQVQDFLNKIGMLESSGGTNMEHPEVTKGINAGTSAVGQYGLMPLTAQDLDRQTGANQLQGLSKEDVAQKLKDDPEFANRLAATLASKLVNNNPSETAAYKWENGQNTHPTSEDLENSQRVQRFRVLNGK